MLTVPTVADEWAKFVPEDCAPPVDGEGEGVPPEATRKATTKAVIAIAAPAELADLGVFRARG